MEELQDEIMQLVLQITDQGALEYIDEIIKDVISELKGA